MRLIRFKPFRHPETEFPRHGAIPRLLLPLMLLGAASCGGGDNGEDNGEEQVVSDAEYFGLVEGRCLGLRGGPGGLHEITIGVEASHMIGDLDVLEVRYRVNGMVRRAEYVHVSDGELLVVRREDPGSGLPDSEYDPPYVLSRRPLHPTLDGPMHTETTARPVDGVSESNDWEISVTVDAAVMEDVPGFEEQVPTYRHFVDLASSDGDEWTDSFSMAPEVGFVSLDLHGGELSDAHLVAVWETEDHCTHFPDDVE